MDIDPEVVNRWWQANWRHGPCPVCGSNAWFPYQRFGQISNLEYAGNMVPVLLVGCGQCGYTIAINAYLAGLLSKESTGPPTG